MATKFIKSPFYNNWFKQNSPTESLIICSPYFKNFALEEIIKLYNLSDGNIKLQVLLRGRLEDFLQGSSDISALESLIQLRNMDIDNVKRLTNLHMKAYLIDNKSLLIGSGNFTRSGLFVGKNSGNVEGAIGTTEIEIITNFNQYFSDISRSSETLETFYDLIIDEYEKNIEAFSAKINQEIINLGFKNESRARHLFVAPEMKDKSKTTDTNYISVDLIPQFSNFEHGTFKVTEILVKEGNRGVSFHELGILLQGPGRKAGANLKYGENQAKLAELLDLVTITHERPRKVYLTRLGLVFNKSPLKKQYNILKQQVFRMPIIKEIIEKHAYKNFNLVNYLISLNLAESTAKRRSPNIRALFKFLKEQNLDGIDEVLSKL